MNGHNRKLSRGEVRATLTEQNEKLKTELAKCVENLNALSLANAKSDLIIQCYGQYMKSKGIEPPSVEFQQQGNKLGARIVEPPGTFEGKKLKHEGQLLVIDKESGR